VVTSNTTSLPEAAGKGAVLVDPKNVYQLARAIEEVLSSGSLREKLVKKGLANARRFDWNESARKLIEIFNRLG